MKRIISIDFLRGLAIIGVLLYHFLHGFNSKILKISNFDNNYILIGKYGVLLFFIISGFVITNSVYSSKNYKIFLYKRFIRIYPTFFISVIITYIMINFLFLEERIVGIEDFLLNLIFFPLFFSIPPVDGVYWSLIIEFEFYFFIAFLIYLNFLEDKKIELLIIFYILIAFLNYFFLQESFIYKVCNKALKFGYFSYFFAGIIFYYCFKNGFKFKYIIILLNLIILSFLYDKFGVNYMAFLTYIFFFIFVFLINEQVYIKFFLMRIVVFVGVISYPLYLLHQNIGYAIMKKLIIFYHVPYMLSLLITILLVVILASLISFYFEKPIIKYFKRKVINSKK